jgi:hypothetical protein
MPVERQGGLITLETTIHPREGISGGYMIRTGIMPILIKNRFDKTKDLDYNKKCPNK